MDYKKAYIALDQLVADELTTLSQQPKRQKDVLGTLERLTIGRADIENALYTLAPASHLLIIEQEKAASGGVTPEAATSKIFE